MVTEPRVILPLDFPDQASVLQLVAGLDPALCRLKVGKELFTRCGPALVERLVAGGFDIFLDLKFHDIPNTVAKACAAAADLGVWMVNVHACGGREMLLAARETLDRSVERPLLIGVTVLTSLTAADLEETGVTADVQGQVLRLAGLCQRTGLDGVVCAAQEVPLLKDSFGERFCLVTPGIRPAGSAADDQKRIMTPAAAIKAGSHYLVIGRPITQAPDPLAALRKINQEIDSALS